jgi:hypothetical protein
MCHRFDSPTMILSTAETASLRAIFPQKPLQALRIEAIRDLAEVHDGCGLAPQSARHITTPWRFSNRGRVPRHIFEQGCRRPPRFQPVRRQARLAPGQLTQRGGCRVSQRTWADRV